MATTKRQQPKQKTTLALADVVKLKAAWMLHALRRNWLGLSIIIFATLLFFWPLVIRLDSYSPGGDAMFNAWTLARDQHCILRQSCPNYVDGNIYFPHKQTMLYSETQLSAGLLTLPLYLINHNPLFSYNLWTIISFLLGGLFTYFLVKYLSKGNEALSIAAGLIFEFAPFKMSAIWHLQNLSIFCLPLALLLVLKYFGSNSRRFLIGLFAVLVYQFYASWYQMVFLLIGLGVFMLMRGLLRLTEWRQLLKVGAVVTLAVLATLPLAVQYVKFSKTNRATFGIADQALYSSSVADYVSPYDGTIAGKLYYKLRPSAPHNAYNIDSMSYHGLVLYTVALLVLASSFKARKLNAERLREYKEILTLNVVGLVGFIVSLGPLLKLKGSYSYAQLASGVGLAIPLPYILVDKFLPQLSFIRAIGRASVLLLLVLCCSLAYLAIALQRAGWTNRTKSIITGLVLLVGFIELMPFQMINLGTNPNFYNLHIPPVYTYIKDHKEVNDIVVLQSTNYPGTAIEFARPETVLWAGYDNKNIFNGYSGYTPPHYLEDYADYVNFDTADVSKLQHRGIRYVLLDKQLMVTKPGAVSNVYHLLDKQYEDTRYVLFRVTK
ncbi:MAG: hypothetical protein JWO41_173 [Candidatus Saccharibacteria bacterium]|nr:hypothetical protein [Candidatus Saccharibacteria bacterium]